METFGLNRINRFVLKKQHLSEDSKIDDIVRITRDIGGLNGMRGTPPYLSLYVRSKNFEKDDLAVELSKKRSLARLRYVRNMVWILPKEFIPVAFAATNRMSGATAEKYSRYLGITPGYYRWISSKILKVLKGRGLTAKEIRKKLRLSVNITTVLNLMCDKGLLIRGLPRGDWKSTQYAYYLFKDYYPDLDLAAYDEDEARGHVIRQYISSFGPVTEDDIAWWTGFPLNLVRRILKNLSGELSSIEVQELGEGFYLLSSDLVALKSSKRQDRPDINILPGLDPYLMGYINRRRYIESRQNDRVFGQSGKAFSAILVDGRVAGVWDWDETEVKLFIFNEVDGNVYEEIRKKAADIGHFIAERQVDVKVNDSTLRRSTWF